MRGQSGPAASPQAAAIEHQHDRQHGRAFGEMHPMAVLHFAFRIGGGAEAALAVMGDQVIDDGAGFGHHQFAVADHRALAQGMHGFQAVGGEACYGVPLVGHDLIGQAQFLQQPEHALRAGIIEVMDLDHLRSPFGSLSPKGRRGGRGWEAQPFRPARMAPSVMAIQATRMPRLASALPVRIRIRVETRGAA